MSDLVERLRDKVPMIWGDEGFMITDDDTVLATFKEAADEIERLREALRRAETILSNMAEENNSMFNRWPVHHEPLRADARNLLPQIRAALGEGK